MIDWYKPSVSKFIQWAVYYTSLQSFIMMFPFSLALQLWGLSVNLIFLVHKVESTYISTNNLIYRRANFEYHHWVCYVHKFISHCLIPIDPCYSRQKLCCYAISSFGKGTKSWPQPLHKPILIAQLPYNCALSVRCKND